MNLFMILVLCSILIYVLWSKHYYPYSQIISHGNPDIRISTGEKDGNYYKYSKLITDEYSKKKGTYMGYPYAYKTQGTLDNIKQVNEKNSDLGIVQEDILLKVIKSHENIRFISALYFETVHFMMHHYNDFENKVSTLEDLKLSSKEVPYVIGTGLENSGHHINFLMVAKSFGLKPIKITEETLGNVPETSSKNEIMYVCLPFKKAQEYFLQDVLDGMCFTMNTEDDRIISLTQEYTSRNQFELVFLSIPYNNEILNHISKNHYYKTNIDTSVYYEEFSKHKFIPSISTRAVLISHKDFDETIAYIIAFTVYQNNSRFYKQLFKRQNTGVHMSKDECSYTKEELPFHKGAYKYYKDIEQIQLKSIHTNTRNPNTYAKRVVQQYWKYPTIGQQEFSLVSQD